MFPFELSQPFIDSLEMAQTGQVGSHSAVNGGRQATGADQAADFFELRGIEREGDLFFRHRGMVVHSYFLHTGAAALRGRGERALIAFTTSLESSMVADKAPYRQVRFSPQDR